MKYINNSRGTDMNMNRNRKEYLEKIENARIALRCTETDLNSNYHDEVGDLLDKYDLSGQVHLGSAVDIFLGDVAYVIRTIGGESGLRKDIRELEDKLAEIKAKL